ncbi:hypothetical protein PQX77_019558 [Marasmius sp. AFHP31]|nr:hypothetical protein PQX77_019558 [Marasmius sp. AFHP31]
MGIDAPQRRAKKGKKKGIGTDSKAEDELHFLREQVDAGEISTPISYKVSTATGPIRKHLVKHLAGWVEACNGMKIKITGPEAKEPEEYRKSNNLPLTGAL